MYARDLDGKTLTFGVSGKLIRNSLVMYDHETGSQWSHLTGEALSGPLFGQRLHQVVSEQTTWGRWRAQHPQTQMLKVDPIYLGPDPYHYYYGSSDAGVKGRKHQDNRLPVKERVIGVRIGGEIKAYSFKALARAKVVDDSVGGLSLVVVFDGPSESGAVYRRDPGGRLLTFGPAAGALSMQDSETSSTWDGLSGRATTGPLVGTQLEQVAITYSFWFGWVDFYPNTGVYK